MIINAKHLQTKKYKKLNIIDHSISYAFSKPYKLLDYKFSCRRQLLNLLNQRIYGIGYNKRSKLMKLHVVVFKTC